MNDPKNDTTATVAEPAAIKRPYVAPRIEESGGFETAVLMCGRQPTPDPESPCFGQSNARS